MWKKNGEALENSDSKNKNTIFKAFARNQREGASFWPALPLVAGILP